MRMWGMAGLLVAGVASAGAEVSCYRTVRQAAVQAGEMGQDGFWLEGFRRDVFGGRGWAMVRSCAHPEWPAVAVLAEGTREPVRLTDEAEARRTEQHSAKDQRKAEPASALVVLGGRRVRVIEVEGMLRLETVGVTQGSGRLGDRVWVRILAMDGDGMGRMAMGVVRGPDLLEIEE